MTIDEQASQVRSVAFEAGMIIDPITLHAALVRDARQIMDKFGIGGYPWWTIKINWLGVLTNRDLRFETNYQRPITEIMTWKKELITAPREPLEQAKSILQQYKWKASSGRQSRKIDWPHHL